MVLFSRENQNTNIAFVEENKIMMNTFFWWHHAVLQKLSDHMVSHPRRRYSWSLSLWKSHNYPSVHLQEDLKMYTRVWNM